VLVANATVSGLIFDVDEDLGNPRPGLPYLGPFLFNFVAIRQIWGLHDLVQLG